MDDGSITLLAALIILVAFSAFFSASETAFSSLNQIRLKSRAEDGDSAAARVLAMSEKYDKLLSTILIGNNIVNIAAASIGTILFTQMLGQERGATVSTIVLTSPRSWKPSRAQRAEIWQIKSVCCHINVSDLSCSSFIWCRSKPCTSKFSFR